MTSDKIHGGHRSRNLTPTTENRGPSMTPLAALQSKLVHANNASGTEVMMSNPDSFKHNPEYRTNIATSTASSIADSHNIQQNLPEIELIKQIIVPSILSPNDMMNEELSYFTSDEELGVTISQGCLDVIKKDCQNFYKIDGNLGTQLEDALFNTGSYIEAILPEAAIDDLINSGTKISSEDINKFFSTDGNLSPLGALGNPDNDSNNIHYIVSDKAALTAALSMESSNYKSNDYNPQVGNDTTPLNLNVTDNLNILKLPKIKEKMRADALANIYNQAGVGLETLSNRLSKKPKNILDTDNKEISDFVRSVYPNRTFQMKELLEIPTKGQSSRVSVGRPLIMKLPSESVIPVHTPSDPSEHIGYFVILDQTGNPIRAPIETDLFENMRNTYNAASVDMSSYLASKVNNSINGNSAEAALQSQMTYEEAIRIYTNVVEKDVLSRLKNGIYGEDLAIGKVEDAYRIMFARLCEKKHTQMLYIPKTLVSYLAFDYNGYGVGKSLIDKIKVLASLRISLMYANGMAVLKNSMTQRTLNVELDSMNQNPDLTIRMAQHSAALAMNKANPFGSFDPNSIFQRLTEASVQTNVTGGAGNFPETKVSMDYSNSNYTQIDTTFSDEIRDQIRMGLWTTPEMIDTAMGSDFATSIVANHALLAKRTKNAQKILCENRSNYIRKLCYNDAIIMDKLTEVIKTNRNTLPTEISNNYSDEEIAMYFINTVNVSLPEPDISKFDMQMEAFDAYVSALDKILPTFINDEMMTSDTTGDLSMVIPATIATIKNYFLRKYIKDNNFMPELFDLVTKDGEDEAAINLLKECNLHVNSIQNSVLEYMLQRIAQKKLHDKMLTEANGDDDNFEGSGGGGDSYDSTSTSETSGDDDFDMDDDIGLDNSAEDDMSTDALDDDTSDDDSNESDTDDDPDLSII